MKQAQPHRLFNALIDAPYDVTFVLRCFLLALLWSSGALYAQSGESTLRGRVRDGDNSEGIAGAVLRLKDNALSTIADEDGRFVFSGAVRFPDSLIISGFGYDSKTLLLEAMPSGSLSISLSPKGYRVNETVVSSTRKGSFSTQKMNGIEGTTITESKKNEVIVMSEVTGNLATNNPRQIYGKISGLNVWENDGAGIQLAIGARGLSPNRSSNFNVRQNGYDISADALGYPESYYTPPSEALERIELIRGASSLQYGTQFGGMLNFVFKKGARDKPIEVESRQSGGSFGFFNSFNSLGGTVGDVNYYGFYQYKRGDGWRPNSGFDLHTAFTSLHVTLSEQFSLYGDYTFMHYLAQQPGGLTDAQFEANPRQSLRPRNWFEVDWNVASLTAEYRFSSRTELSSRTFGLFSGRNALGNLDNINRFDLVPRIDRSFNRTLIMGRYENIGNETRLLHRYEFADALSAIVFGTRIYRGTTTQKQGDADSTAAPTFVFRTPTNLENSDYRFPNTNVAVFAENLFRIGENVSVTIGARYEYIDTRAEGSYRERAFDFAGNVIADRRVEESLSRTRDFIFFGGGATYLLSQDSELYVNLSQNFRSITFSDLRIDNPNFRLDPNITDEFGYNAELGFRGTLSNIFLYDLSVFYLRYRDRINNLLLNDTLLFNDYRFRTNVGDTETFGLESLIELDIWRWLFPQHTERNLSLFSNLSIQHGRYIRAQLSTIVGNEVELVPPITWRVGMAFRDGPFRLSVQYNYIHEHFTDATNTRRGTPNAVSGLIPSYSVMDVSASYVFGSYGIEGSINNLLNAAYFTRRAEGYPGPGILPADGRAFFLTVFVKL